MNKTRKLLALIIGAAAAAAALHGVTAEAWSYTPSVSDPAEAPEGYETFDGAYSDYLRIYPIEDAVAFYRSTDNPMLFAALTILYSAGLISQSLMTAGRIFIISTAMSLEWTVRMFLPTESSSGCRTM